MLASSKLKRRHPTKDAAKLGVRVRPRGHSLDRRYLHREGGGLVAETVRLDPVLLERFRHAAELLEVRLPLLGLGELGDSLHATRGVCYLYNRIKAGFETVRDVRDFRSKDENRDGPAASATVVSVPPSRE